MNIIKKCVLKRVSVERWQYLRKNHKAKFYPYVLFNQDPHPQAKKGCKTPASGQKFTCKEALKPHPWGRTRLKKLIKDMLKRHRNVLKMGIGIKQNHLLKLKYSLHIFETVFPIVVLISIDTWITVVLQIYTLKLRDSY